MLISNPVVFDSNNLVFNYRKKQCDSFEKFLFQVENISGGGISNTPKTSNFPRSHAGAWERGNWPIYSPRTP